MSRRQVRCIVSVIALAVSSVLFAACSSSSPHADTELLGVASRAVQRTSAFRPEHLVTCCANVAALHTMSKALEGAEGIRPLGTLGGRACGANVYAVTADADPLLRRLKNVEGRVWQGQRTVEGRRVRVFAEVGFDYEVRAVLVDSAGSDPQLLAVYSCE